MNRRARNGCCRWRLDANVAHVFAESADNEEASFLLHAATHLNALRSDIMTLRENLCTRDFVLTSGAVLASKADDEEGGSLIKKFAFFNGRIKQIRANEYADGEVETLESVEVDALALTHSLFAMREAGWKMELMPNSVAAFAYSSLTDDEVRRVTAVVNGEEAEFDSVKDLAQALRSSFSKSFSDEVDKNMEAVAEVGAKIGEFIEEVRGSDVIKAAYKLEKKLEHYDSVSWEGLPAAMKAREEELEKRKHEAIQKAKLVREETRGEEDWGFKKKAPKNRGSGGPLSDNQVLRGLKSSLSSQRKLGKSLNG